MKADAIFMQLLLVVLSNIPSSLSPASYSTFWSFFMTFHLLKWAHSIMMVMMFNSFLDRNFASAVWQGWQTLYRTLQKSNN